MKRRRYSALLIVLLSAMLAYAGGSAESGALPSDPASIPEKPEEITILSVANATGLWDYVDEWEAKTGIKVNISEMDLGSLQTQAATYFATRSSDIDLLYSYVATTAEWAYSGHLENIGDYLTDEEWAAFLPGALNCVRYKGDIYGLPYFYSIRLFYCNMDLLNEHGFSEPPETWEEAYEIAKACTDPSKDQYGILVGLGENESAMIALQDFNAMYNQTLVSPEDEILFANENGLAALKEFVRIHQEGILDPASFGVKTGDSRRARFLTGNVAMAWEWAPLLNMIDEQGTFKAEIGLAPKVVEHATLTGSEGLVVSKYSKNKYWAVDLLKYLTSEDVQTRYAMESGWFPVRSDVFNNPEVLAVSRSMEAAKRQSEYPTYRWAAPYYSEARAVISDNLFKALSGELTPEVALENAKNKTEEIIKQYM